MPHKIIIKYLKDLSKPWNVEYAAIKTDEFGDVQIGLLNGAVCFLYFAPQNQLKSNVGKLMNRWKQANFHDNSAKVEIVAKKIFSNQDDNQEIEVVLDGTDFQINVWETLLKIPEGQPWTYSECAQKMGKPAAVRAVASAVARNEVAYLIPCHRVISKNGSIKYGWGPECKTRLLDYEAKNKK